MKNQDERGAQPAVPREDSAQRKPYATPTLVEHGSVESVTAGGRVKGVDLPSGSQFA